MPQKDYQAMYYKVVSNNWYSKFNKIKKIKKKVLHIVFKYQEDNISEQCFKDTHKTIQLQVKHKRFISVNSTFMKFSKIT